MMRILMFFHGGSGNRGCEAIVVSAIKVIRQRYPDAYIALASTNPNSDKHIQGLDEIIFHDQSRQVKSFSPLFFKNYFKVKFLQDQSVSYHLAHKDIIDRIDDFDVFLSIGGDNYCYGDLPDYYELNRLIKAKNKKIILWGASLGKEDLNAQKIEDLKAYDALNIRESVTEAELKAAGLINTNLVADGAFLLDIELLPLPNYWNEGNTIGFNYSPLVEQKIPKSRSAVLALLNYILKRTDFQIALTPHVVQPGNDDYQCMQTLIKELDQQYAHRFISLPNNLTASQYKGYISRMEVFIGARTHASIAAYSTAVPPMVLGYSIKSIGIATDLFGFPKLVLDQKQITDSDLLIAKFDELLKDREMMHLHLKEVLPSVQLLAYSANNYI